MKVVAIIAVRNGESYVKYCLEYLFQNNIDVFLIENSSTDSTLVEINKVKSKRILGVHIEPYLGAFDLANILAIKEEIRSQIDADWIIHQDIDEILQSEYRNETLFDSICRISASGYQAINCKEFVFIPESENANYEGKDYHQFMQYFYHFAPAPKRLIRIFENSDNISNIKFGGHRLDSDNVRLYPSDLSLRHYIALSMPHFRKKYSTRIFEKTALAKGWHGNKLNYDFTQSVTPPLNLLSRLGPDRRELDASRPFKKHFWQWHTYGIL